MTLLLVFVLGFLFSAIGILPPGLINLTAAKISVDEGKSTATSFVLGACLVIFVQTFVSLSFAKFINTNPTIIYYLKISGIYLFSALTIYFLFIAKKGTGNNQTIQAKSKSNRFFYGVLISALNLFPIPYYVFLSVYLSSYNVLNYNNISILLFVLGVVLGAYLVFYLYLMFFNKYKQKADFLIKNSNYLIGCITGFVALMSFIKLNNFI